MFSKKPSSARGVSAFRKYHSQHAKKLKQGDMPPCPLSFRRRKKLARHFARSGDCGVLTTLRHLPKRLRQALTIFIPQTFPYFEQVLFLGRGSFFWSSRYFLVLILMLLSSTDCFYRIISHCRLLSDTERYVYAMQLKTKKNWWLSFVCLYRGKIATRTLMTKDFFCINIPAKNIHFSVTKRSKTIYCGCSGKHASTALLLVSIDSKTVRLFLLFQIRPCAIHGIKE